MKEQTLSEHILSSIKERPEFPKLKCNISISSSNIRFSRIKVPEFKPTVGETYLQKLINERFNSEIEIDPLKKSFFLSDDNVVEGVKSQIGRDIMSLFVSTSYNKAPRMTKVYKSLKKITHPRYARNSENDEVVKKMASILNYHDKVLTESELSIKHEKNAAHRKNLYSLLVLMEKKYGKAE